MIDQRQRSKITADLKKNRLMVTIVGTVRKADVESIYTDIRFCVRDLQAGFDVITDMRNSKIGYLSGAATFRKILAFLQENKVGRIVRVTGESRTFLHQINRITKAVSGYSPIYVQSLEEVEEVLQKDQTQQEQN